MKTIKVDKVVLYYMDRVDPDGNLYRFLQGYLERTYLRR